MTKFRDLDYLSKRKKLREYYGNKRKPYQMVTVMVDDIRKKFGDTILDYIKTDEFLLSLLIDGYVAYERIWDDNREIIGYNQLDASTLKARTSEKYWIQHDNSDMKRVLNNEQILFISYNDIINSGVSVSFVNQIQDKIIKFDDWQIFDIIKRKLVKYIKKMIINHYF